MCVLSYLGVTLFGFRGGRVGLFQPSRVGVAIFIGLLAFGWRVGAVACGGARAVVFGVGVGCWVLCWGWFLVWGLEFGFGVWVWAAT